MDTEAQVLVDAIYSPTSRVAGFGGQGDLVAQKPVSHMMTNNKHPAHHLRTESPPEAKYSLQVFGHFP